MFNKYRDFLQYKALLDSPVESFNKNSYNFHVWESERERETAQFEIQQRFQGVSSSLDKLDVVSLKINLNVDLRKKSTPKLGNQINIEIFAKSVCFTCDSTFRKQKLNWMSIRTRPVGVDRFVDTKYYSYVSSEDWFLKNIAQAVGISYWYTNWWTLVSWICGMFLQINYIPC